MAVTTDERDQWQKAYGGISMERDLIRKERDEHMDRAARLLTDSIRYKAALEAARRLEETGGTQEDILAVINAALKQT